MGKMTDALRKAKLLKEARDARLSGAGVETERAEAPPAPAKVEPVVRKAEPPPAPPIVEKPRPMPAPVEPPPRHEIPKPAPIPEEEFRAPWSIVEEEPVEVPPQREPAPVIEKPIVVKPVERPVVREPEPPAPVAPVVEEPVVIESVSQASVLPPVETEPEPETVEPPAVIERAPEPAPEPEPEPVAPAPPPVLRAPEPETKPPAVKLPAKEPVLPAVEPEAAAPPTVEAPTRRAVLPDLEPTPAPSREPYLSVHFARDSRVVDEFRKLKASLCAEGAQPRVIMVSSSGAGEGKTTLALNLATIFANTYGEKVVLVDGNVARAKIGDVLNLPAGGPGLDQVARGMVSFEDAPVRTEIPGLWAVPAGTSPQGGEGLLESKAMTELLNSLRRRFTRVIMELPSADEGAEGLSLASQADVVLVPAMKTRTRRRALRRFIKTLSDHGASKVLCVFIEA